MSIPLLSTPGHSCSMTIRVMRNHPLLHRNSISNQNWTSELHISTCLLPHPRSGMEKEKSFARTHQTSCNRRTAPPPLLQSRLWEKTRHRVNPGKAEKHAVGLRSPSSLPSPHLTLVLLLLEHATLSEKDHRVPTLAVPSGWNVLPPVLRRLLLIQVSAEV